jgi:hypothetical protein
MFPLYPKGNAVIQSLYKTGNSHTDEVLREQPVRKPVFLFRGKESATVLNFPPPEVSVECSLTGKERAVGCVVEKKVILCCQPTQ